MKEVTLSFPVDIATLSKEINNEANAQFIVTACNSHDELVEALKLAISALNQIPNTANDQYGTTYKLILKLENVLAKS